MLTAAIVVIVLLALNALFVAAEFAALGARESRIQKYAAEGSRSARLLLPYVTDVNQLDRYISSCQLGITVTSLFLGAYGEHTVAGLLHSAIGSTVVAHGVATVIALVALTSLQVVMAEQVPKSMALHRPDRTALITVWPVVMMKFVLGYVIAFLNASARATLWLIRAPVVARRHVHSRQEIDLIIEQSRDKGAIEADQHDLLQHVLDLEVVTARQLMIPRCDIAALDDEANAADVVQLVIDGGHTRMPVYHGSIDDVVGVIHTKDLARHAVEKGAIKEWAKLVRPMSFVNEGMTADRLLATLREKKTTQAMVMDEFGGVAGLVTLEDVLTHVFGEVGDEFSASSQHPQRLPDGLIRLPGRLRLEEVEEWVGTTWTGSSTTLGGFVAERAGHLPSVGERLTIEGAEVRVESVENHVVTSVLVRPAPKSEAPEVVDG
jgi:magnesium and cobalt exporter, CNNM family